MVYFNTAQSTVLWFDYIGNPVIVSSVLHLKRWLYYRFKQIILCSLVKSHLSIILNVRWSINILLNKIYCKIL